MAITFFWYEESSSAFLCINHSVSMGLMVLGTELRALLGVKGYQ